MKLLVIQQNLISIIYSISDNLLYEAEKGIGPEYILMVDA